MAIRNTACRIQRGSVIIGNLRVTFMQGHVANLGLSGQQLVGVGLQYAPASGRLFVSITTTSTSHTQTTVMCRYDPHTCTVTNPQTVTLAPPPPRGAAATGASDAGPALNSLSPNANVIELNLLPATRSTFDAASLLFFTLQSHHGLLDQSVSGRDEGSGSGGKLPPAALAICLPSDPKQDTSELNCQPISLQHGSTSATDSVIEGVTAMPCPATHQTLVVLACSKGNLYFHVSTRPTDVALLDPAAIQLYNQLAQDNDTVVNDIDYAKAEERAEGHAGCESRATGGHRGGQQTQAEAWQALCRRRRPPADAGVATASMLTAAANARTATQEDGKPPGSRRDDGDSAGGAGAAALPLSVLEKCEQVASSVTYGGDVESVGGSEGFKRLLCDMNNLESYVEGGSRSALKLTLKVRAHTHTHTHADTHTHTHTLLSPVPM